MLKDNYDKELERAIQFLVFAITESGHNPKPVILHSIKVALYLQNKQYSKDIVIASCLHDLLEDTKISEEELKNEFGEKILNLVKANTFDDSISDKTEQYKEMFTRTIKAGKEAMIIKAADILENSYHWDKAINEEQVNWLITKEKHFLELTAIELKDEVVYKDLQTQVNSFK